MNELIANGKIVKNKTLSLPTEKSNSTADNSNNNITSDKWAQLYGDIAGIKSEFIPLNNLVMEAIRSMKVFNKLNFKP